MTQGRLLLVDRAIPRLHSGPCIEALRDEQDTDDPDKVTCPDCLKRRARVKPLTWAQEQRRLRDFDKQNSTASSGESGARRRAPQR